MKISIITVLDNTNYGTYLQALATGIAIQRLGYQVEIIRYTRKFMTPSGYSRLVLKERGFLRWFNRCVLKSHKKTYELREKDIAFLESYLPVTREYVGYEDLCSAPPMADIYVTGSDQVWNSFYNRGIDRSFYLDFVPIGKKKVSYATSIGMPEFPAHEEKVIIDLLHKYKYITVREVGAKDILAKLGINSEVVLDPTLLLNKDEWIKVAERYPFNEREPYLLTYSVEYGDENDIIKHYAQRIAKKRGLKLYHITYGSNPSDNYYDKVFCYDTPDQFLKLMLHSSFVVVSSFHGTAFSINFNKPFITVSPKKFNSRIQSLLKITGLESRVVTDISVAIDGFADIDYNLVNKKLDYERLDSINKLQELLQ